MAEQLTKPVLIGVLVFAASQYFLKIILEPIIAFRKCLAEISHVLLLNRAPILNGLSVGDSLGDSISELSARLRSSVYLIPYYRFWSLLTVFAFPLREHILLACRQLNLLSYNVRPSNRDERAILQENGNALKEIERLLRIEVSY